jgi:abhydrolase domain-containing protein 12
MNSALYAHKVNTVLWHDIDNAEQFGFAKNQVTPFHIPTPDGETLYAWHVLPIDAYMHHEKALGKVERPHGSAADFTKTLPFQLLTSKQHPARVVVNCERFRVAI